ncbi:MAG: hypothetical protein ACRBF0_13730 [Calditrichia bacterium]
MNIRTLSAIIFLIFLLNLGALLGYMYFRFVKPAHVPRQETALPDAPERRLRLDRSQRRQLAVVIRRFHHDTAAQRSACDSLTAEVVRLQQSEVALREDIDTLFVEIGRLRVEMAQNLFLKLQRAGRFLSADQQEHVYKTLLRSHYDLPASLFSVDF